LGNPIDIHMNPKEGTLPQPAGFLEGALLGNPTTDIHMNPKEGTLPQPDRFLESTLPQLIGGEEQLGTSPKEVVDQI
jgi:hypothetical protein